VEHGARAPKHEIVKRSRTGPVVSARDHMRSKSKKRGQRSSLADISCHQGKDRGCPFLSKINCRSQRSFRDFGHRDVGIKLE
jgi:hypothetical protein